VSAGRRSADGTGVGAAGKRAPEDDDGPAPLAGYRAVGVVSAASAPSGQRGVLVRRGRESRPPKSRPPSREP
jgi:hypothetical protein